MKKKLILLLVITININYFCFGQQEGNARKVELLQIAYFTKELTLTTAESEKFWPVYNNYKNEIRAIRQESHDDPLTLEEKLLNTRKKYKNDFKLILGSDERVNKVFVAEKAFREILIKELEERNNKRNDPPA